VSAYELTLGLFSFPLIICVELSAELE